MKQHTNATDASTKNSSAANTQSSQPLKLKYWLLVESIVKRAALLELLYISNQETSVESEDRVNAWFEALWTSVDYGNLEFAYRRALNDHRGRGRLTPTEIIEAHERLLAENTQTYLCRFCEASKADDELPRCPFHALLKTRLGEKH